MTEIREPLTVAAWTGPLHADAWESDAGFRQSIETHLRSLLIGQGALNGRTMIVGEISYTVTRGTIPVPVGGRLRRLLERLGLVTPRMREVPVVNVRGTGEMV